MFVLNIKWQTSTCHKNMSEVFHLRDVGTTKHDFFAIVFPRIDENVVSFFKIQF